MKDRKFGNDEKLNYTNSVEALTVSDPVSARAFNRPILNLLSEQEDGNIILQALLKKVFKGSEGVIPGAYEEFNAENIRFFKLDDTWYLRIPTGILLAENGKNFSVINKPNIDFAERRYAQLIGLNLNNQYADLKIQNSPDGYYIILVRNAINGSDMERFPSDSGYDKGEELFSRFVRTYSEKLTDAPANFYKYNALETCINASNIIQDGHYNIYYTDKEKPINSRGDLSNHWFMTTDKNPMDGAVRVFELDIKAPVSESSAPIITNAVCNYSLLQL